MAPTKECGPRHARSRATRGKTGLAAWHRPCSREGRGRRHCMDPTLVPGAGTIPLDFGWSLGAILHQVVASVDWRVVGAVVALAMLLAAMPGVQELLGSATLGTPAEPLTAGFLDGIAALASLRWRLADLLLSLMGGRA